MSSLLNMKDRAYFIGIGGIGMSALARYFIKQGWRVAGYDKTPSPLTDQLIKEGMEIHFEDLNNSMDEYYTDRIRTLVVYTPAVPKNLGELLYFQHAQFDVLKRSEVLGLLTETSFGIGVAGTHGKTTTSTLLAHVLNESSLKCNAFLGGISSNFNSNVITDAHSDYTVVEADEFDRSFLRLSPKAAIITSCDPDHLDIYGDQQQFYEGFQLYAQKIDAKGFIVAHHAVQLKSAARQISYGLNTRDAEVEATNVRVENERFFMDVRIQSDLWKNVELGVPGTHNAENALACLIVALELGLSELEIRHGLKTFKGVKRRFEYHLREQKRTFIDDYAHHPTEIKALIDSIRLIYPNKSVLGVFQPHLFSRTRDFFEGFAEQLSRLDELILMPIYPAREEPIPGVTSDKLLEAITLPNKKLLTASEVVPYVVQTGAEVVLTIGAGDIDRIVEPLKAALHEQMD